MISAWWLMLLLPAFLFGVVAGITLTNKIWLAYIE